MDATTTYVIRFSGTISTKSPRVRSRFAKRLATNVGAALEAADLDYELRREWNRLFVESAHERTGEILSSVFGIQSIRPSTRVPYDDLDDLVEAAEAHWSGRIEGRTFGVSTRRVGDRGEIPFTSPEANEAIGTVLDDAGGEVDLDDPEVPVRLEVHGDDAYLFDHDIPGPGGLPLGTEGRALMLVSGGFDSAVAAWMTMRRGVALDFLFFNLGGPAHERGVREVTGELLDGWGHGLKASLHVVDFRPLLAELKVEVPESYWQIVLKRLMMRAASEVADRHGHPSIVTGEAIGQVSTQTAPNLAAIEAAVDVPILRPLIAFNKQDIIERARSIGVHDRAEQVPEFCAIQRGKPVTASSAEKLDKREALVDHRLLERAVDEARVVEGDAIGEAPEGLEVQVDYVPEGAEFLDLRRETDFEEWHPPDAMHVPFETAVEQYPLLPNRPTWLLYCDVGLKSAMLAEKMRQHGFDAYSFEGGVPALREYLASRSTPVEERASSG